LFASGACGNVGFHGDCRQKSSNQQGRSTFGVSRGSVYDRDGPSGFQDDQPITVSWAGDIRNVPLLKGGEVTQEFYMLPALH